MMKMGMLLLLLLLLRVRRLPAAAVLVNQVLVVLLPLLLLLVANGRWVVPTIHHPLPRQTGTTSFTCNQCSGNRTLKIEIRFVHVCVYL